MDRLADVVSIGNLPAFVEDDTGLRNQSLDLILEFEMQLPGFLFLESEERMVYCLAFLAVARLRPSRCVHAPVVDPDDLLELGGQCLERTTVGRVRVQNVLDDFLEVKDVDFVVLAENGERASEVVLALDFLRSDVPQQLEVDALVDVGPLN